MRRSFPIIAAMLALLTLIGPAARAEAALDAEAAAAAVDPLGRMAVYADGRIKSFDSFASTMMRLVSGARRIEGRPPTWTYIDMMMRPEHYATADVINVRKKPMRAAIADALRRGDAGRFVDDLEARLDEFMETGLISETLLSVPEVQQLVEHWRRDVIRTAKFADQIETAAAVKDPIFLLRRWCIVPPPEGDADTRWFSIADLSAAQDPVRQLSGLTPEQQEALLRAWAALVDAWMPAEPLEPAVQAERINAAGAALAAQARAVNPAIYPDPARLEWESFYFRSYNLTWIWIFYALSIVPLMLNVVFRWPAARWVGLGLFALSFAAHTGALLLRWYVAGRWPNSNMFEAVTTSVWFGGCAAIVLEIIARRTPMRSLFALGSAVASMVALMCAWYMPVSLDAGIENRMPVLHDVWLYIHTNVIIFSYCLIFMAAVTAALYLLYRLLAMWRGDDGGIDAYARAGGAASLILTAPSGGGTLIRTARSIGTVLDGTTMILMELSFIMLWSGLVMGAIWADHSWGRPWGWDPKEVFALNTFIVFAVLIHVRMTSRDKGLWTALIAMVGAGVMLFNWIAINFVITGLHSYA